MRTTHIAPARPVNHANLKNVEVDRLEDQLICLLLGARKSTREVRAAGVSQLRRDIKRKRLRPFSFLLRTMFADVDENENVDDVVCALHAMIAMVRARAELKRVEDLAGCIVAETEVEGRKKNLEVAFLAGDRSTATLTGLERAIDDDFRTLEEEAIAIRSVRYPEARRKTA